MSMVSNVGAKVATKVGTKFVKNPIYGRVKSRIAMSGTLTAATGAITVMDVAAGKPGWAAVTGAMTLLNGLGLLKDIKLLKNLKGLVAKGYEVVKEGGQVVLSKAK